MEMEVIGRHVLLFDDDAMAAFVNSSNALVEWNSIPIDRYDVRHLLSSPPPPRRRRSNHHITDSTETELDQERYVDLSYDQQEPDDDSKQLHAGGYNAVGFSYGKTEDSADHINSDSVLGSSGFIPPFAVPENLVIPPTEKLHQIIARTSVYVSKHGAQSEIVLRVKQGDNPTFGFLMPDHHLHSYFRYLVDNSEVLHSNAEEKPQNELISDAEPGGGGGALSLLGSLYGLGEDEDGAAELTSEKNVSGGANNASATVSYMSEKTVSPKTVSGDAVSNHTVKSQDKVLAKPKDKVVVVKRNSFTSGLKSGSGSGTRKEGESFGSLSATMDKLESSMVSTSIIDSSVLEPPSQMRKLIAKIVEFIMKNGKQFEAVLVEQDSEHGRFPFLLPSNQYNQYYLKVLQEAQKAKVSGRSSFDEKDGSGLHKSNKKTMFAKGSVLSSLEPGCDFPFDSDRKEKFKMVIGKSKNDGQDPPSKATQEQSEVGVDAAAAAAILQAATRGIRTPNLNFLSRSSLNRKDNSSEGGHASSLGSKPSSQAQNGASSSPAFKEIAKIAALEAASEADSHEAHLTKEQKLKAERLRRAKMFVAMIKSGSATQIKPESSRGTSAELCPVSGDAEVHQAAKEPEGSKAPLEVDKTENIESFAMKFNTDEYNERKEQKGSKALLWVDKTENIESSAMKYNTDEYNERKARRKYRSNSRKYETAKEDIDDEEDEVHKHSRKHHREDVDEREIKNSRKKHRYHTSDDVADQDRHEKDHKYSKKYHRYHKSSHDKDEREEDYDDDDDDDEKHHKYSRKYHRSHKSSDDEDEREEEDYGNDEKDHKYSRKHHRSHKSSYDVDEREEEDYGTDEKDLKYSRKNHRSYKSSQDEDEEDHGERRSRKKHWSRHSSHHSRHHSRDSHSHKHRKRHRSSKNKESRHRNKHDLSSDEEKLLCIGSDKLSGKIPVSEREDLEEGEISAKLSDQSRGSVGGGSRREPSVDISSSFQNQRSSSQPSNEPTEISDDLRAKVRAMLLGTL